MNFTCPSVGGVNLSLQRYSQWSESRKQDEEEDLCSSERIDVRRGGHEGVCILNQQVAENSGGSSQERLWNVLMQQQSKVSLGGGMVCSSPSTRGMYDEDGNMGSGHKGYESEPEIISRRLVENFKEKSGGSGNDDQPGFQQIFA